MNNKQKVRYKMIIFNEIIIDEMAWNIKCCAINKLFISHHALM